MTRNSVKNSSAYPVDYGPEFLEMVRAMHAGAEALPAYESWIVDHMGGRVETFRRELLRHIRAFTELENADILDFGCGTGSTTVMLAEVSPGNRITAADIDPFSLEMAEQRFRHHGISSQISMIQIPPVREIGDLDLPAGGFDFILMNGVLEHVVPFEDRGAVLLEVWRLLRHGGMLFISETPNSLWPVDRHTTGLPFVSWLPSSVAHRYAVAFKRHNAGDDLDSRGRRGMTYWGIVRPLRKAGKDIEVLNLTRAHNRLLPAGPPEGTSIGKKRRLATFVLEDILGRILSPLGIPVVAFGPFIEYLCLKKVQPPAA
jgi:2-polyprenyl-3-methyl-5-hydroxy-6-metoxy-1,4-benzoquinol methylase